MPVDSVVAGPQSRTSRGGWGWVLLAAVSQSYLVILGTLAASALLPMLFGLSGTVVQSGSMRPLINVGDVVLTQALPASAAAPMGRVIIFRAPVGSARAGTELHRLVAINADGSLVTAGDANADPDSSSLDRRDILGQGRLLVPWVGLPSLWVRTGAYGQLALWAIVTILAVIVLVLGPGKQRGSPPAPDGSLTATSTGLTSAGSTSFTITVGPASRLGFTVDPSTSAVSASFGTQPRVAIQDAGGNTRTNSSASVTLVITPPTGGATLSCSSNPRSTSSGIATFSSCKINRAGTYTLTATATGLTAAVSHSFVIFGPATKLGFTTNPSGATGGTIFANQPVVAVQDAVGNTVTSSSTSVTLAITTPGGATLRCTSNPKAAVSGVASFAGCRIDKAGTYTLTATATGLTGAVSTSLTIS